MSEYCKVIEEEEVHRIIVDLQLLRMEASDGIEIAVVVAVVTEGATRDIPADRC